MRSATFIICSKYFEATSLSRSRSQATNSSGVRHHPLQHADADVHAAGRDAQHFLADLRCVRQNLELGAGPFIDCRHRKFRHRPSEDRSIAALCRAGPRGPRPQICGHGRPPLLIILSCRIVLRLPAKRIDRGQVWNACQSHDAEGNRWSGPPSALLVSPWPRKKAPTASRRTRWPSRCRAGRSPLVRSDCCRYRRYSGKSRRPKIDCGVALAIGWWVIP